MKKDTKHKLLTTRELCAKLKIHRHTLEKMVKEGLPIADRKATRGRGSWMFDPEAVAAWAVKNGRDMPAITGEQVKSAVLDAPEPDKQKTDADQEPITLQLQAERSQYQKMFARFLRINAGDDAAGVAALSKAITLKSDALRRLELSVLDHQKQSGELVSLSLATRTFSQLAGNVQQRMMSLPNELAPVLREYLRDPDDVGKIHDEIDAAIRRALMALPEKLPELEAAK